MATGGLYGQSNTGATPAGPTAQTTGLYGVSTAGATTAQPSSESNGLYGNPSGNFGGTYFEWFVFQESATQPATPTGGSWNFQTNTGTPPTGWSLTPPVAPIETIWVSISLVNSRSSAPLVWSTPSLFGAFASVSVGTTTTGAAGTDASVTNSGTTSNAVLNFTIPRGDTGQAATVTAGTTTTGAAGSSASVVNSGTSSDAIFDFTIPQGVPGVGIATGGTTGQFLTKASNTDYDTTWTTITGTLSYQGSWNASTNTPTLTSSVGTNGHYYVVSVAGTTNLNGITDWQVGDWAIFNGSVWQKIDQTNTVTSVNGYTGAVVLTYSDVGAANAGANTNITSMSGITGGISSPDYITFDTSPGTIPSTPGTLYWDSADGNQTLSLIMAGGTAVQQIGEEQYYRIKASSAITNGQVVMFTGTVGASGALTGAPATGLTASTASYVMGVATQDIPHNGWGYVTSFGLIRQIDTSAFSAGDILYLNPSVPGGLTKTVPVAPNPKVQVCACVYSSASNGSLFIRPSFGGVLGQYEGDVNFTSLANGDLIVRNQTTGVWENKAQSTIIAGNVSGTVAIANGGTGATTASAALTNLGAYPSSNPSGYTSNTGTVTSVATGTGLTGGPVTTSGTISLANTAVTPGSYTNASLTVDQQGRLTAASSGTAPVTSVTGTAPVVSSGGTTPAISMAAANSTTNGYLTSTDWNTFNNKQPSGTYVNSVSATAPLTSTGGTTPTLAMPAASASANGYLTSADWSTFNSKQPAGTYVTSVSGTTGRVTSSGGTTPAIDLATTTVTAGTYTAASITVDAYGRITSASSGVGGATISNDTTTASNLYPAFANTTSGNVTTLYTSNSKYLYNPSTGTLSSSQVNASNGVFMNADTISANTTIPTGSNGFAIGPQTIASGAAFTVSSGQRFVLI